ncbi:MAG: serine/threonine protein kinase [Proteobacteria bacterium]|nr:serine/threonine protein kinase [Pseudomonadota bacterium]
MNYASSVNASSYQRTYVQSDSGYSTPHSLSDHYQFVREIGHGSQGRVYLAERLSDHKKVVVKQLNIGSVKNWKEYTLFKREGEVLSSLHIDGVAEFYESRECLNDEPPCAYIVQEYIPGKSIQALLNENWRFDVYDFYDVVLQLLAILDQLQRHDPPIIHRDIKPSNIILVPQKRGYKAYLIDFGAVANPQVQGGGSTVAGTFGYMAPEQLMGAPVPASDIYSLGALIVHVLSGVSPANMPVKDFRLIFEPEVQSLPHPVVEILRRMLEPKADERLSDIDELRKAFEQFRSGRNELELSRTGINDKKWTQEAYIKKLQSVTDYGADGNIELWSELPDNMDDSFFNDYVYQTMNLNELGVADLKKASEQSFFIKIWNSFKTFVYNLVIFPFYAIVNFSSFICLSIIVSMSLIPVVWPWIVKDEYLTDKKIYVGNESFWNKVFKFSIIGNILWVISFVFIVYSILIDSFTSLFVLAVIWGCIYILHVAHINLHYDEAVTKDDRIIHIKRMSKDARIIEKEKAINLYLERLNQSNQESLSPKWLINARKTMATVIDIQYESVQDVFVLEPDEKNINYMVYGVPSFRVIYSFNPPDDTREEDLHHAFITHSDPTGFLKEGDPLPILYCIERGSQTETVRSMPFPLVWKGHLYAEEVMPFSQVSLLPRYR